jgi:hypothetical protein
MKRSITRWITTLSTAAAIGVPAIGMAQTPTPQAPPQQQTPPPQPQPRQPNPDPQQPPAQTQPREQQPTASPATPNADKAVTPQEHLREAKAAMEKVQSSALTGRARTQFSELRRHLTALEGTGAAKAPADTQAKAGRQAANWGTEAAAIDKILSEMLGDSTTGTSGVRPTPGTPGATGATGSKAATAATLDEATRSALMDVRKHVMAYAAAMAEAPKPDAAAPRQDAAMSPSGHSPAEQTMSPSGHSPARQTTTPSEPASQTALPTEQQPPAAADAQPPAATSTAPATSTASTQSQVDQEAARTSLTAARDSLNQLTQLPAAAQLTGETREQVTQLIANFNELITTQTQWRASYDKVGANLTALLGADSADASAASAPAQAPTAETPAEPGAVGTSGKAELDPAVRAKLVEMRSKLADFEKAMGGSAKP